MGRRATPAQKTQVVQELRQKHKLEILLTIAQRPRATFYYHLKQMQAPDKYETAKAEITAIYHENKGRYGCSDHGWQYQHKYTLCEKGVGKA